MRTFLVALIGLSATLVMPSASAAAPLLTVQPESVAAARSIPRGAQRVPMLRLRLRASCDGDVRLTSVTLRHRGLGDPQDVSSIYVFEGGARVSRAATVRGREGITTLQMRGFRVRACAERTVDILGDYAATAAVAGEHAFILRSSSDVLLEAPGSVTLAAPSAASPAVRTAAKQTGEIAVEYPDLPGPLSYGPGRTVARVRLRADGVRDQSIRAVTFTNQGSAADRDLQHLFLETGSHERLCGPTESLTGDQVRLPCDPPFTLRRNETRLLNLRADIRASRRRTIQLLIEEPADLEAGPLR